MKPSLIGLSLLLGLSTSTSWAQVLPQTPTNLQLQPTTGLGIRLTWQDQATDETGYQIQRASLNQPDQWQTLAAQLPANQQEFIDSSLNQTSASAYRYRVRAFNGSGYSGTLYSTVLNPTGFGHPKTGTFAPVAADTWGSQRWPLGGHFVNQAFQVGVYSKNASRILLEVYDHKHWADAGWNAAKASAKRDYWLVKGTDDVWRASIKALPAGSLYGFRVWGNNWPWDQTWSRGNSNAGFVRDVDADGSRFNPNKLLTDPYSYELSHDTTPSEMLLKGDNGGIYGTGGADLVAQIAGSQAGDFRYQGPLTNQQPLDRRQLDTALWAPKSVAIAIAPYTGPRLKLARQDNQVMEASVRGLTRHASTGDLRRLLSPYQNWFDDFQKVQNIPERYRGTYKGAAMLAPYLKALGVNTLELLPVHESGNDQNDLFTGGANSVIQAGQANFWGYMTYSFFAPDRRFSSDKSYGGPTREFREMVQAFAEQGIEVWLDVVYNHSGEGGNWGNPFVTGFNSLGGFDSSQYYHLNPFDKRWLESGATGTGNQLNFSKAVNQQLVLDSLNYWIDSMGIGGFRFDLAAVLGRDPDRHQNLPANQYWDQVKTFYSDSPLLKAIATLGQSKGVKMTAEAWDLWGYPVGSFPAGWGEWNGRFRDAARKYLKGDPSGHDGVSVNDAFHGDYRFFNGHGGPQMSTNFLVAHDGFTLADLVSYNGKNNQSAYPFGPSDGGNDNNDSWDSSGPAKPSNLSLADFRRQRLRNFWVFQIFSRGSPMFVYGDEFGRTQNGNNNPYNLDSPATWNNYRMLASNAPQSVGVDSPSTAAYHNNLGTASNKTAQFNPLLSFSRQLLQWRKQDPTLRQANYQIPIQYRSETGQDLDPKARARRIQIQGSAAQGNDYLLFVNMWQADLDFQFPEPPAGTHWARILDTAHWAEAELNTWTEATAWRVPNPDSARYGTKAWSIAVFKAIP